jgi:hypothetical protein
VVEGGGGGGVYTGGASLAPRYGCGCGASVGGLLPGA